MLVKANKKISIKGWVVICWDFTQLFSHPIIYLSKHGTLLTTEFIFL